MQLPRKMKPFQDSLSDNNNHNIGQPSLLLVIIKFTFSFNNNKNNNKSSVHFAARNTRILLILSKLCHAVAGIRGRFARHAACPSSLSSSSFSSCMDHGHREWHNKFNSQHRDNNEIECNYIIPLLLFYPPTLQCFYTSMDSVARARSLLSYRQSQ